jgi:hypothetical protein
MPSVRNPRFPLLRAEVPSVPFLSRSQFLEVIPLPWLAARILTLVGCYARRLCRSVRSIDIRLVCLVPCGIAAARISSTRGWGIRCENARPAATYNDRVRLVARARWASICYDRTKASVEGITMRSTLVPLCLVLGLGGCQLSPPYPGHPSEHAAVVPSGDVAGSAPGRTPALRQPPDTPIDASEVPGLGLRFLEPGFGPPDIPPPGHPREPPANR